MRAEPAHALSRAVAATDPILEGEMALKFRMSLGELRRRFSLHELTVFWPEFFRDRREQEIKRQKREEDERQKL